MTLRHCQSEGEAPLSVAEDEAFEEFRSEIVQLYDIFTSFDEAHLDRTYKGVSLTGKEAQPECDWMELSLLETTGPSLEATGQGGASKGAFLPRAFRGCADPPARWNALR